MSDNSSRGPQLLLKKMANALVPDAEASATVRTPWGSTSIDRSIRRWKKKYGGLWVGGTVQVTSDQVSFSANALNRGFTGYLMRLKQMGTLDFGMRLADIDEVSVRFGVGTKIVVLEGGDSVMLFRCWGAHRVADIIRDAAARAA